MKIVRFAFKKRLTHCFVVLLLLVISLQSVQARQSKSPCQVLTSSGSWTDAVSMDFAACANTVYVANAVLHTTHTYGIWGQTVIDADTSGEIQTATVDDLSQIDLNSLNWEYWGNIAQADTLPDPSSSQNDVTATPVPEPLTLDEIFTLAEVDINDFWTETLASEGVDYEKPDIVLYDNARVKTKCGTAPSEIGPFYCGKDNTAYFPRDFMTDQHDRIGDYAVVVIIAHEWGHSIQTQLANETGISIQRELQADCYAGAYSQYAVNQSQKVIIEDGDIDEAIASLFEAGDGGGSWFDRGAHGDGDQRRAAFTKGLTSGVGDC
ncbi:MAG: hypothetical protein GC179_09480 [Anaerolineaceae bacterium]|nr:hypothetical protein [Anaerolineaceae bacterium]